MDEPESLVWQLLPHCVGGMRLISVTIACLSLITARLVFGSFLIIKIREGSLWRCSASLVTTPVRMMAVMLHLPWMEQRVTLPPNRPLLSKAVQSRMTQSLSSLNLPLRKATQPRMTKRNLQSKNGHAIPFCSSRSSGMSGAR